MSEIKFYIPKSETIPTELRLHVDDIQVTYYRIDHGYGFRFEIYTIDDEEAMEIVKQIVKRIEYEHDDAPHGVTWVTTSLEIVPQEERYKVGTIIDWKYRIRDSY